MEPKKVVSNCVLVLLFVAEEIFGQMSTDPKLCGGYFRWTEGHIDFRFNENTAPPSVAQEKKFCMWTIAPTVPSQRWRYNITIRNVNLDCSEGDIIAINFFNETSDATNLGLPQGQNNTNPLCIDEHSLWSRENAPGNTMVVILYVEQVVYGKGFYLEWEPGWDSRMKSYRIRNTYYSYGRPSVEPLPYFAGSFMRNEIATYGFIKANYTDGRMEMFFERISHCEGQGDWFKCYNNTITVFSILDSGVLKLEQQWTQNQTLTPGIASKNGFFIIVKIQDAFGAGARFSMIFDTVRGYWQNN